MSSQEEYLDQLLKGMVNGERVEMDTPDDSTAVFQDNGTESVEKDSYDVDDVKKMGIEDINRIIEENERAAKEGREDYEAKDLTDLMDLFDDSDIRQMKDYLVKADRNEALDESIVNMIEMAKESGEELPQDLLEQMQEEAEDKEDSENNGGLLDKLFGGKNKNHKAGSKPLRMNRAEEFEYENIVPGGKLNLIDGDEQNKSRFEIWKDKRKAKKQAKLEEKEKREKEKQEELAKNGENPKKKRRKKGQTLEEALGEVKEGSVEGFEEEKEVLLNPESFIPSVSEQGGTELSPMDGPEQGGTELFSMDGPEQGGTELSSMDGPEQEIDTSALDELLGANQENELSSVRDKEEGEGAGEGTPDLGLPQDLFGDAQTLEGGDNTGDPGNLDDLMELAQIGEKGEKPGKKGFFAKLFAFLTEEDEEEKKEGEGLILSDENDAILKELDKEDGKKKKKKPKKGKGKEQAAEGEDEEIPVKKEKKAKKPKKVKEPKTKAVEEPGKKLSKKRVQLIFLVCIALGAAFYVLSTVTVEFSEKKRASAAFQAGDYEECYQNLVGKKLNESEQVMFGKSESILRIRLWMKEYEMLAENGQEAEALDSLMQSVHDYPTLYAFSGKWNAVSEVQAVYEQMMDILNSKYRLTEEEAKIIANEEDDLTYSKMVRSIAAGGSFDDWEEAGNDGSNGLGQTDSDAFPSSDGQVDRDLLPEEEGLPETVFVD